MWAAPGAVDCDRYAQLHVPGETAFALATTMLGRALIVGLHRLDGRSHASPYCQKSDPVLLCLSASVNIASRRSSSSFDLGRQVSPVATETFNVEAGLDAIAITELNNGPQFRGNHSVVQVWRNYTLSTNKGIIIYAEVSSTHSGNTSVAAFVTRLRVIGIQPRQNY